LYTILRNPVHTISRIELYTILRNTQLYTNLDDLRETYIVVSIRAIDNTIYYNLFDMNSFNKKPGEWNRFNLSFQLPQVQSDEFELAIYVWNKGRNELFYDDIEVAIY